MQKHFLTLLLILSFQTLASDNLSSAFKACVDSSIAEGSLGVKKVGIDGTSKSLLMIQCYKGTAKALYQEAHRFSYEYQSFWSKGDEVITRRFGGSSCNRRLTDSEGNEVNYYWCNLKIDIVSDMIKALNL